MECSCPLGNGPRVFAEGPGVFATNIAIVGEAPGYHEDKVGRPFVGPSGRELDKLLLLAGLTKGDVFVTNLVMCRPVANRVPTLGERAACRPRLTKELKGYNTVVLLGATATSDFLPGVSIGRYHGIPHHRGQITYIPMYHPAACLHNPKLRSTMMEDWLNVAHMVEHHEVDIKYERVSHFKTQKLCAVDTEIDGGLIAMSVSDTEGVAFMLETPQVELLDIIMHNAKFDLKVLRKAGLDLFSHHMVDTMIAAFLCGYQHIGLKVLALKLLGVEMLRLGPLIDEAQELLLEDYLVQARTVELPKSMAKSLQDTLASNNRAKALSRRHALRKVLGEPPMAGVKDVKSMLSHKFFSYSCADADMTFRLWPILQKEMESKGVLELFHKVEMPLVKVLANMEDRGLAINRGQAEATRDIFQHKAKELGTKLCGSLGVANLNSRDEIARVLYDVLGLRILGYTDTGKPTTARWALETLAEDEPLVEELLAYRHYVKLVSTYLDPWLSTTGRIHADFNQVRSISDDDAWGATATGRLSSSGPNFQNIPGRTPEGLMVRSCIVAERGRLVSIDDKQIELVLMAIDAQDNEMIEAFRRGEDIHSDTAKLLFDVQEPTAAQRYVGKQANFMWGYGIRASQFAKSLTNDGVPTTRARAQELLSLFEAKRPMLKARWHKVVQEATSLGYATTMWGRRRYLPELQNARTEEEHYAAAKQAYSHRIQGTAADISKVALIEVDQRAPGDLVCAIHDERLLETILTLEEIYGIVKETLGEISKWGIPHSDLFAMSVKEGPDWGHLQKGEEKPIC